MGVDQLYPIEYIQYLIHFHGDRDYFECHEILEDYWKKQDYGNKKSIWVGFIQLAVSAYHHRRGNFDGAKKTMEKAIAIFSHEKKAVNHLGLNNELFFFILDERFSQIEHKINYESFNFPISDPSLIQRCKSLCKEQGLVWCSKSDLSNHNLLHRHILRDRTGVIQERLNALFHKKGNE